MKRTAELLLTLSLVIGLALPAPLQAKPRLTENEAQGLIQCGFYVLFAGMLAGYAVSGGAAGAMLSHQRGFFESDSAYEARLERNRAKTEPLALLALSVVGTGVAVMVAGFVLYPVAADRISRRRIANSSITEIEISGLSATEQIVFNGVSTGATDGRVHIQTAGTSKPQVIELTIESTLEGVEPRKVVVEVVGGQSVQIDLTNVGPSQQSI